MTRLQKYEMEQQKCQQKQREILVERALPFLRIKSRAGIVDMLKNLAEEHNNISCALASFHMEDMTPEGLGQMTADAARMKAIDDFLTEVQYLLENLDVEHEVCRDSPYNDSYPVLEVWLHDEEEDEVVKVI